MNPLKRSLAAFAMACVMMRCYVVPGQAQHKYFGLEADVGMPSQEEMLETGWGVQTRAGIGLPVPVLRLDTEIAFDFMNFPGASEAVTASELWRLTGGLRAGVDIPVVPYVFGHLGYGHATAQLAGAEDDGSGLAWTLAWAPTSRAGGAFTGPARGLQRLGGSVTCRKMPSTSPT
jgi:hypothetical protein